MCKLGDGGAQCAACTCASYGAVENRLDGFLEGHGVCGMIWLRYAGYHSSEYLWMDVW